MPACSTASLGALSLAGRGLGQSYIDCDWYNALPLIERDRLPAEYAIACRGQSGGVWTAAPAGGGGAPTPTGNGNGNGDLADVLTSMFGAAGQIFGGRGQPGAPPPPLVQQPAARTGMVMLPLIAVGVVIWMFARGGGRRRD